MKSSNVSALATGVVLADVAGTSQIADQMLAMSAQMIITGSGGSAPAGSFKLQFCNTPPQVYYEKPSTQTITPWSDFGSAVAVSGAGTYAIPKTETAYQWTRVFYDNTAAIAAALLANQSLTYTAITAGVLGNSITIALVDPGAINQALTVTVVGTAISVSLATNGAGTITSSGNAVKAAVNANATAALLVLVTGTNGSAVIALAPTPLASGTDGGIITSCYVKTLGL